MTTRRISLYDPRDDWKYEPRPEPIMRGIRRDDLLAKEADCGLTTSERVSLARLGVAPRRGSWRPRGGL